MAFSRRHATCSTFVIAKATKVVDALIREQQRGNTVQATCDINYMQQVTFVQRFFSIQQIVSSCEKRRIQRLFNVLNFHNISFSPIKINTKRSRSCFFNDKSNNKNMLVLKPVQALRSATASIALARYAFTSTVKTHTKQQKTNRLMRQIVHSVLRMGDERMHKTHFVYFYFL